MLDDVGLFTPYSTVKPLFGQSDLAMWAPELDRDRIAAYQKYEEIYWQHEDAFKLVQRGDDDHPIYIPNPRTICDTTAHFWMKGLGIMVGDEDSKDQLAWEAFMVREGLLSKFHTAKHSGVVRGDFILHLTADPTKPEGMRISVNSVDPASYFPEYDDDDLDRILAVNLVEQVIDPERPGDPEAIRIRRLRYSYEIIGGRRRVFSEEAVYKVKDWWKETRVQTASITPKRPLPENITTIPVYHFKNIDWQGQPFGSSELRGFERVQAGINQSISDEELALALEGLGVYATDAGRPVDESGNEEDWIVSPGKVMELPAGGNFRRVEGVNSVKPFQDHLSFLVESLYEASGTFRGGTVEAQVAESGIALAIRFLPTTAKLEQRDQAGVDRIQQFVFDWKQWHLTFENQKLQDSEAIVSLGEKLPQNKTDLLNAFNNMVDRKTISKKFYREQLGKLYGISFPKNIDQEIEEEAQKAFEAAQKMAALAAPKDNEEDGNQSNNKDRPNESGGTEANQPVGQQTRR